MEALFKKQFWVVNLMFLAANAFLLARASNQFIAYFVTRQVAQGAPAQARRAPPPPAKPDSSVRDLDEADNMFGAKPEVIAPPTAAVVEPPKPDPINTDPVPTGLRIKLSGVTWYEEAEWSLASIIDLSTNDTALYSINDCPPADEDGIVRHPCNKLLNDAEIKEIEPERVIFLNRSTNRMEFIDLHEEANRATPAPAVASAPVPSAPANNSNATELGKGITKVAENQYRVPQSDVDEVLQNLNSVATQARIVPSFEGGKANGFKLFSIRPGSIYNKIGIQNGDVVNRINGYEITSPDKALEVYSKLQSSKEITVDLTRRGQKMTVNYSIQ